MNCGEIVSMRGVTPATVSHHLKILSEAGLIACRREGQFVYSHAVPETIAAYTQALAKIARGKKTHKPPLISFSAMYRINRAFNQPALWRRLPPVGFRAKKSKSTG